MPFDDRSQRARAAARHRDARSRSRARLALAPRRASSTCAPARARSRSRSRSELPAARVIATEISPDAAAIARANAARNGVADRVEVRVRRSVGAGRRRALRSDRRRTRRTSRRAVIDTLSPEVRREPRLALDGGADGLAFYDRICARGARAPRARRRARASSTASIRPTRCARASRPPGFARVTRRRRPRQEPPRHIRLRSVASCTIAGLRRVPLIARRVALPRLASAQAPPPSPRRAAAALADRAGTARRRRPAATAARRSDAAAEHAARDADTPTPPTAAPPRRAASAAARRSPHGRRAPSRGDAVCKAHDPSCDWVATFSSLEQRASRACSPSAATCPIPSRGAR